MGGFLYVSDKPGGGGDGQKRPDERAALDVFARVGSGSGRTLERPGFRLTLFEKQVWPSCGVVEFENGDFIAATGTLFFRGKRGEAALRELFEASGDDGFEFSPLLGHFAVFVYRAGVLEVFNDYHGLYQIFSVGGDSLLSSSFLAACASVRDKTVDEQALHEYVALGAFYGEETLFREVRSLPFRFRFRLGGQTGRSRKRFGELGEVRRGERFEDYRDEAVERLQGFFRVLVDGFGDRICSALSGGYDSRMMVAAMRSLGVTPKLYVYGKAGSKDRVVAQAICEGEGIELDAIDKGELERVDEASFPAVFERQFLALDGRNLGGTVDDGGDEFTRRKRLENAELQVNGAGGEIYRQGWQIPGGVMTAREFLSVTYERSYVPLYEGCRGGFDRREFFDRFAEKVHAEVSDSPNGQRLENWQIEHIRPMIRQKYCMNLYYYPSNLLGPAMVPYFEPSLTLSSCRIPMRFKMHGRLQRAAIAAMDPRLAGYVSQDGLDYACPIPAKRKLRNHLKSQYRQRIKSKVPISVLSRLYRMARPGGVTGLKYFEGESYLRALFGSGEWLTEGYFRRDAVWDEAQFSRLVTVEYLLRNWM